MRLLSRVIASILTLKDNFSNTILNVNKNTRSFQNEILHAQNSVVKFKEKAIDSFGSILGKASMLAGGIGFIEMGKKSIEFASDLTEVQNVVDVTFGDMNKQINDWSKNAINKYGENELQAKNFASTFGAMLKAGGVSGQELVKWSEVLSGYVGDLASFRNLKLDESFEKIRSAISGETEPMKALGYDVSETAVNTYALAHGIGTGSSKMKEAAKSALDVEAAQTKYNQAVKKYGQTSLEARQKAESLQKVMKGTQPKSSSSSGGDSSNVKLTQAEKLQARLGLLQQLMKDVDGDFVRTKDSFANQIRIAQSQFMELGKTIGTKVLPPLTTFLISLTSGNIGHFGDSVVKVFDSIGIVINNIKPNLENLWNSVVKFSKNMGITDFFKNMFGGKNTKLINDTSYALKVVIDSITEVINIAAAHPNATKAVFAGIAGGLVALKGAEGAIKILGTIEKVQKATKGMTGLSKIGGIFKTLFKIPPGALIFIAIIATVAAGAYLIISNWSKIKPWVTNNFTYVKNEFTKFWNFAQPWILFFITLFDPIIGIPLVIMTYWSPISAWFKKTGDDIAFSFNQTVLWFEGLPGRFWNSAVNTFQWFKNGAWSIISGIGDWVVQSFNGFVNFFVNLPTNALQWGADIVHSLKNGIVNTIDDAVQGAEQLAKSIVDKVKHFFGIASPSKVFTGIGYYLTQGLIKGMTLTDVGSFVKKWAGNIVGGAGSAVSGNVSDWISQALSITGTDSSWLSGMLKLASYESGDPGKLGTGDPNLVNNIPVGDEYATGLMQMLPSTFREYQFGNLSDIKNPIANIAAAIQYIKKRYGSVYNTPLFTSGGSYAGYATGTNFAGKGIRQTSEYGAEIVFGRHYRAYQGGEKVVNASDTSKLLGSKGDLKVYVIVQGNVIGDEEYADYIGNVVVEKVKSAYDNM